MYRLSLPQLPTLLTQRAATKDMQNMLLPDVTSVVCAAKDTEVKATVADLAAVLILSSSASLFATHATVVDSVASALSRTDTFVSVKSLAPQLEASAPTAVAMVANSALLATAMVDVALV